MFYKYSTFCAKKNIRKPKPNTPPLNPPPPKKKSKTKNKPKNCIYCLP